MSRDSVATRSSGKLVKYSKEQRTDVPPPQSVRGLESVRFPSLFQSSRRGGRKFFERLCSLAKKTVDTALLLSEENRSPRPGRNHLDEDLEEEYFRESFYFFLNLFKKTYDNLNIEGIFQWRFEVLWDIIKLKPFSDPVQNKSMQNPLPEFFKKEKMILKIFYSICHY